MLKLLVQVARECRELALEHPLRQLVVGVCAQQEVTAAQPRPELINEFVKERNGIQRKRKKNEKRSH